MILWSLPCRYDGEIKGIVISLQELIKESPQGYYTSDGITDDSNKVLKHFIYLFIYLFWRQFIYLF